MKISATCEAPSRACDVERVLDPVLEQRPVRQARQVVVERLVGEPALEHPALGDVPEVGDDPGDVGLVEQVRQVDLDPAPLAVLATEPELDGLVGRPRQPLERVRQQHHVVLVDVVGGRLADALALRRTRAASSPTGCRR